MGNIPILATISTLCIVLSAIFVAIGIVYIKRNDQEKHKKMMICAAVFAVLFFLIYASRTVFIGNTSFGGPEHLKIYYTIFLIFHIALATLGAALGIYTIWLGFKKQFTKHRKIGPLTSIVWFLSAGTGLVVYLLLYIFFQGGETTSLIKAILGF